MTASRVGTARDEADAAAAAAGVDLRSASIDELVPFLESIWGGGRVGDESLLRAIAHAGNSVLVATRDTEPIGAALGVLGWEGGIHLHSHMVAVAPGSRASGIGFAIKLAQRAECLEAGVSEMRWTYDPLIRRNAYFNLVKLGASVTAFHPNFYGTLDDAINGSDTTDRFEVSWRLDAPLGRPPLGAPADLELPENYERLRSERPDEAREVRERSTGVFSTAFAAKSSVIFTGSGYSFM